ncbi:MAG: hypothetical protein ACIAS6_13595 [Phycisphaerales bacterium JB060]
MHRPLPPTPAILRTLGTPARTLAGVLALAGAALAQDTPTTDTSPDTPTDEQAPPAPELPEAIRELLLGVSEPGATGMGTLAVEGSVLPERPGLLRRTPYGEWAFVFMGDDGQPRAMVLLPCRQLERMIESVESAGAPAVRLTGTLTVYDRVNYLLPTNYAIITPPTTPTIPGAPAKEGEAGEKNPGADPLTRIDPALRAIADELESGRRRARSLEAPPVSPPSTREAAEGQGADGQEQIERDAFQEGDRLVRRRARLERQRGLWALTFDQDTDASDLEAPLLVLPNNSLREMERAVNRYGDQVAFEVSGTVYRFGRQPYVLISMHFIQPLEGLKPRG